VNNTPRVSPTTVSGRQHRETCADDTKEHHDMSVSQELRGEVLDQQLNRVADQLTRKFADRVESGEIHDAVHREAGRYQGARVTQFIPVLVQHAIEERLRQRLQRTQ
jgi:hypothetical protein